MSDYSSFAGMAIKELLAQKVYNDEASGHFTISSANNVYLGTDGASKTIYIGTSDNSQVAADISMGDASKTVTIKGHLAVAGTTTTLSSTTIIENTSHGFVPVVLPRASC